MSVDWPPSVRTVVLWSVGRMTSSFSQMTSVLLGLASKEQLTEKVEPSHAVTRWSLTLTMGLSV